MARTKRYVSEEEELRRWREGLDTVLRKKRKHPILKGVAIALVIVAVGTAGAAAYFWREIEGLFTRTEVALDPIGGGALNILLIGSDSREGVEDPDDIRRFGSVGGRRADTIILAQIVPGEKRGVLLHFPRDLWVTVPADSGSGRSAQRAKINSAYQDGPQAVIDTIQEVTGVPINHYMEVDITGFRNMVDAIGGIDVCMDASLYDSKLRFKLPAGVSHLDGNAALSFVRARHATPDGDFGRIRRQQQFLKAVVRKVGSPSVLGNPVRVNALARAFALNVTVDQHFRLDDMVRFALDVKRIGPDQLATYSVPGRIGRAGGQSVVLMDESEASLIFQGLQDVVDPAVLLNPPVPDGTQVGPDGVVEASPEPTPVPSGPCADF